MHNYRFFAKTLLQLLGQNSGVQIFSHEFCPLFIKNIGLTTEGHRLIAISRSGPSNSEKGRNPEMVFALHESDNLEFAEPLTLINETTGTWQNVYIYDEDDKRTLIDPQIKNELTAFGLNWFSNLKAQGFFDDKAVRAYLK